jgi:lipopolysaccharide/colanic/teichoic acid biosynthesis glycosyltransferase
VSAARLAALPAADAAGLAAAAAVTGAFARDGLAWLAYAVVVLALLSPRQRPRICLRVTDQAGWITAAALLPLGAGAALAPGALPAGLAWWSPALVLGCRAIVCAALRAAHHRGHLTEPALIVGAGTFGGYVAGLLRDHPEFGLVPAGLVDDGSPRRDLPVPSLGPVSELAAIAARSRARWVILCFSSDCRDEDMVAVLRACRPLRADVRVVPRLYEIGMAVPRGCLDEIWGVPLIPLRHAPRLALAAKRATDILAAVALALAAAPAAALIAAAVRLESGRPVLFRQARVTGEGRVTTIWKFRTVRADSGADGAGPGGPGTGTGWTVPDGGCGPVGRWLRATHLDELPQLANVLLGQMSLVGPRPERPYFARQFGRDIPRYADRTRMRGGLTGLAQVHGLNGDTSVYDRARFDNYYVEYWSPWLDTVIVARTLLLMGAAAFPWRRSPARLPGSPAGLLGSRATLPAATPPTGATPPTAATGRTVKAWP